MTDRERKNKQFAYIELIVLGAVIIFGITQLVVFIFT